MVNKGFSYIVHTNNEFIPKTYFFFWYKLCYTVKKYSFFYNNLQGG